MSETVGLFSRQIALIAVVLVLHTYIGLHIIRRTLIFSDLVLDQLAAFGILVGVALHIKYGSPISYLLAMVAVLFGSLLLALINPKSREIPREAVIGILYALALVMSLMLTDKLPGGACLCGEDSLRLYGMGELATDHSDNPCLYCTVAVSLYITA